MGKNHVEIFICVKLSSWFEEGFSDTYKQIPAT